VSVLKNLKDLSLLDHSSKASILYEVVAMIKNEKLRELVVKYLEETIKNESKCSSLEKAPGEIFEHHSYPGGLVDHTIAVVFISGYIAKLYSKIYGISVNMDLIYSCALLHDLYKVYEFCFNGDKISRCTSYYPHDVKLSARILIENNNQELAKCIIEVHGYYDYTSIESLIVGLADQLDAKFHNILQSKIYSMLELNKSTTITEFYKYMKSELWKREKEIKKIMKTPPKISP